MLAGMALSDQAIIRRIKQAADRGRAVRLRPETAVRLALALEARIGTDRVPPNYLRGSPATDGLSFTVESSLADGMPYETIARAGHASVAVAAYEEALKVKGRDLTITLREGARVLYQRAAKKY